MWYYEGRIRMEPDWNVNELDGDFAELLNDN